MADEEDHLTDLVARVDELLDQATGLRRRWEQLGELLLDERPGGDDEPAATSTADDADPRLLIALDMALSGRTRAEADEYLRNTFGPDGVDEILAAAYERR
ncbi:MAG: hypothetical protein JWM71_2606 [Solirubrobacteraceae bacterium]|nr:hypothetical protein [Solirubrobacteraceae bacterium]